MLRAIIFIFFIGVLSCLTSCSDEVEITDSKNSEFSQLINLEVGNYWVYEKVIIDSSIETSFDNNNDTLTVLRKFDDNGIEVIEISCGFELDQCFETTMVMDSADYLMHYPSRSVIFTTDPNYIGVLNNMFIEGEVAIKPETENIVVPAGEFTAFNLAGVYNSLEPDYPNGQLTSNKYFVKDVGFVQSDNQFYSGGQRLIKRLVDFGKK